MHAVVGVVFCGGREDCPHSQGKERMNVIRESCEQLVCNFESVSFLQAANPPVRAVVLHLDPDAALEISYVCLFSLHFTMAEVNIPGQSLDFNANWVGSSVQLRCISSMLASFMRFR